MMKKLIIVAITMLVIFATASAFAYVLSPSDNVNTNSIMGSHGMGSMMGSNMMSGMMSQIPEDVIVKVTSRQMVPTGQEAKITLLVLTFFFVRVIAFLLTSRKVISFTFLFSLA